MIKNYEETNIFFKVLLDEHHLNILKLLRKHSIEIPKNFEEIKVNQNESFDNKTLNNNEDSNLINTIDKLFEKYNNEKKYEKKIPLIKLNENFIKLIQKN